MVSVSPARRPFRLTLSAVVAFCLAVLPTSLTSQSVEKRLEFLDTFFAPEEEKPEVCRRGGSTPSPGPEAPADTIKPKIKIAGPNFLGSKRPLYVFFVDGRKVVGGKADQILKSIAPEDIENIRVIRGAKALEEYGSDGDDGVVEITLKRLDAKHLWGHHLHLTPTFTRALGHDPPDYGFGLVVDWLVSDRFGIWASGYPYHDSDDCPLLFSPCPSGEWMGSVGASVHFRVAGFRPFLGIGRGAARYEDGTWDKSLWSLRAGIDFTGDKWFGLRAELVGQVASYWQLGLGIPLGVIGRSTP